MEILLETERLLLRRFEATDAEHLVALDGDPEVMRFLSGGRPTPREVIESDILPRFRRYDARHPAFGFWAAIERASGDFLGWFSFRAHHPDRPEEVALGFRLRRSAWGRGYAAEGGRALLAKGFAELGVERVTATTYQDNVASRRVLEKLGLTLIRRFRLDAADLAGADTFAATDQPPWEGDDLEYALEREAWERQRDAGTGIGMPSGPS